MDRAADIVETFALQHRCATVSWGVVVEGQLGWAGGFIHPLAAPLLGEHNGPPGPRTRYRIASMTKSFSAAATLALRDEGVFGLDDPVTRWAPELDSVRGPTTDAADITIRHLLTMTSGLITDDPWADRHLDMTAEQFDEAILNGAVFAAPTGVRYEYSNFGFALLERVVFAATGRPLRDHVERRLFSPLRLSDSSWAIPEPDEPEWMPPLRWYDDIGFASERAPLRYGMIAPMGGIVSSVGDVGRWMAFLDDAFPARDTTDSTVLSRATRREMQFPHAYAGRATLRSIPHSMSYGMGLRILDEDVAGEPEPRRVVNHSGGFPGYGSNMRWLPGRRLGVVALSNTTYAPMTLLTALLLDLAVEHFNPSTASTCTERERAATERLARDLVTVLNDWHDDRAAEVFADNVEADLDGERRRANAARVTPIRPVEVEVVSAGRAVVHAETCRIMLIASPLQPLRVQSYTITPVAGAAN